MFRALCRPTWQKLLVFLALNTLTIVLIVALSGPVGSPVLRQLVYVAYASLVPFDAFLSFVFSGRFSGNFFTIALLQSVSNVIALSWQYLVASVLVTLYRQYACKTKVIVAPKRRRRK